MTKEKIKQVMDACYQAKRVRDMMPKLPNGVTPTHIHYLDVITRFERSETDVKVSDISDELGLPRPGVTKTWTCHDIFLSICLSQISFEQQQKHSQLKNPLACQYQQ